MVSDKLNIKTYPEYLVYDGTLYKRETYVEVAIINTNASD